MRKLFFIALAIGAFSLTSCKQTPKLLTPEEVTHRVDSLYNSTIATLGPELDKTCETVMSTMVQAKADSIVAAKQAEMAASTSTSK
ncbi:MAG: hypothetical protein KBA06_00940 [Saprospiraceae bacterium]|nr:hypothetical protein [Saprospiraceae bacterium]